MVAVSNETLDGRISLELRKGLGAREVERRIAEARRAGDIGARAVAFYLVDAAERGVHLELGAHSIAFFALDKFGIERSTTYQYLFVGRRLEELIAVDEAFCRGELFYTQVRLLVQIATPETESAWIEWARHKTVRQLANHIKVRELGQLPTDPARRRIHEVKVKVLARLDPLELEKWNTAREKLEAELGRKVSDKEMILEAAELLLKTRDDGTTVGRTPVNDGHFQIVIRERADGGPAEVMTADGPVPIEEDRREQSTRVDRESTRVDPDAGENDGPDVPPDARDRRTPPGLLARVLRRDGNRCRCCGDRLNPSGHHKRYRRKGGRTEPRNLATECENCHSLIHAGYIELRGDPEDELRHLDRDGNELGRLGPDAATAMRRLVLHVHRVEPEAPQMPPQQGAKLSDLIGQRRVIENLTREVRAAGLRERPIPHLLLTGPPGLGKTSLARAVAAESNSRFQSGFAPHLDTVEKLEDLLAGVDDGHVLLIDEIHRLPPRVAETLYPLMDAGLVTVIGATTEPNELLRPLRNRFALHEHLEHYSEPELAMILLVAAKRLGLLLDDAAAEALARVARETPRVALALLDAVHTETVLTGRTRVDEATVEKVLKRRGIDRLGLTPLDREYLATHRRLGGATGLGTIAAAMGVTEGTLRTEVEPYLLRIGMIVRTPRGRVLVG